MAAWRVMLDHVPEADHAAVIASMEQVLSAWLVYRDDVATACGLSRDPR
ncbi:MAG: hypothetical protein JNJ54_14815 [Myxococcaceae bacterium]|nr:hypothetical protein [Myxococcaceae bacterium]